MVNLDPSNHSYTAMGGPIKGYETIYASKIAKIGLITSSAEYVASLIVNVNI